MGVAEENEANAAQNADAYRAVGAYVVEFSRVIFHIRLWVVGQLDDFTNQRTEIAGIAMSEATAAPIANAFFAICELVTDLDDDEKAIAHSLQKQVNNAIQKRNDFMHGDWWIGWGDTPGLGRIKPTRRAGIHAGGPVPTAELDALSDGLAELRDLVANFGLLCSPLATAIAQAGDKQPIRVRDVLVIRKGRVRLEGPR